jgi:formamidopyrimidine-DNA glycosylase
VPELPDITLYLEALEQRIQGTTLKRVFVASPFLLRTAVPPLASVEGRKVVELRRLGKRICIGVEGDLWLVLHLMIAGRLHWYEDRAKALKARGLATFEFSSGALTLTEAGTQKRASLHVVEGDAGLERLDPGGLEVFTATEAEFAAALQARNHTLKRALTDPRILSGIGNAYSDEILHAAKLSPFRMTDKMEDDEVLRLHRACKAQLTMWTQRLRDDVGDGFPDKVTAFRPEMAVHGKYGQPCPVCGTKVQRIVYADNEANYCPTCQTEGRLLADRSLSRLLKEDWPKTLEELEDRKSGRADPRK